jgi:hypothetical protein
VVELGEFPPTGEFLHTREKPTRHVENDSIKLFDKTTMKTQFT